MHEVGFCAVPHFEIQIPRRPLGVPYIRTVLLGTRCRSCGRVALYFLAGCDCATGLRCSPQPLPPYARPTKHIVHVPKMGDINRSRSQTHIHTHTRAQTTLYNTFTRSMFRHCRECSTSPLSIMSSSVDARTAALPSRSIQTRRRRITRKRIKTDILFTSITSASGAVAADARRA